MPSFDPVTAALQLGSTLIDRFFPDPAQRDAAKLQLLQLQQQGDLAKIAQTTDLAKAQIAVDAAEAASGSVFVAGWRPAVGWICAGAFAYALVLRPLLPWTIAVAGGHPVPPLPDIDMSTAMTMLGGMLGLGGLRTYEKVSGVVSGPH